jgi:CheY-like chemotaxis protein
MMQRTCRKILIIDDDPDLRGALAALLENQGYSVVEAEDGRDGLERLRSSDTFCLIVLDLFMPGMNGWAFRVEQMKDPRLAAIPVLVITADSIAAKRAIALGMVAAMTKPVEFDRVLQIIRRHC